MLLFTGLITNTGSDAITLAGDTNGITSENGTLDDSPFLNYVFFSPVTLNPYGTAGDSTDLALFNLSPGAALPGDTITGTFDVQATDGNSNTADSGAQSFSALVPPNGTPAVPEPSAFALLGLGLLPLALIARRRLPSAS
jgi:hypothetical protein